MKQSCLFLPSGFPRQNPEKNRQDCFVENEMKICGVYQILNNVSGRCYIGQSYDIEKRLKEHFGALRKGCHRNQHLQSTFDKYGEQVFSTRILTRCCPEYLTQVEQGWMERFKVKYNKAPSAGSLFGYKLTAEHKAKLSAIMMGHKYSLGCKHTSETKEKVSAALMGNKYSLGYKQTAEHKARISAAKTGKNLGHCPTDEQKKKLSAIRKAYWAKKKQDLLEEEA